MINEKAVMFALCAMSVQVQAFQAMDDAALSNVTGQDGLTVNLETPGIAANQLRWEVDSGNYVDAAGIIYDASGAGRTSLAASLVADGVSLRPVDANGFIQPGTAGFKVDIDVGSTVSGEPALQVKMELDRIRMRVNALRHSESSTNSYGTIALDTGAKLDFVNVGGVLNNDGDGLQLKGEITDANLFYRQLWHEHPYLILANLNALWRVYDGSFGIGAADAPDPYYTNVPMAGVAGLRTWAPFLDVRLSFDQMYKFPVGLGETEFTITGQELGALHFGWQGTLVDAEVIYKGGGIAYANAANRSQGLNLSSRWNFLRADDSSSANPGVPLSGVPTASSPFRWRFGEVGGLTANGGHAVRFELSDWKNLPGVDYGHNFPYIAFDVINAGQGARPLCWGGRSDSACGLAGQEQVALGAGTINDFIAPTTTAGGLALSVRDGNLLTYAETIRLFDGADPTVDFDSSNGNNREFDWGLIYTLANIDGDIYLYPGGNPSDTANNNCSGGNSLNCGIIADIVLMSQTFDEGNTSIQGSNWSRGSHLLIADTDPAVNMAIGFSDVSFLLQADDTRIWVKPNWNAADNYEGGLDLLSRDMRLNLRGTFGGRDLVDVNPRVLEGILIDLNYEGLMNLRISPSPAGQAFVGFSGALRATSGTFLSLAEPSAPAVEMRLADLTGDVALINGRIDLVGANEEASDGFPKLRISQDIQIGQTAAARMNDAVIGSSLPGGAAGQALVIGAVEFAGKSLGSIAIPSGQLHTSLTLRPQTPSF